MTHSHGGVSKNPMTLSIPLWKTRLVENNAFRLKQDELKRSGTQVGDHFHRF